MSREAPLILNGSLPPSSQYRYAVSVWKAFERRGNLTHLLRDPSVGFNADEGQVTPGFRSGVRDLDKLANNLLPRRAFRSVARAVSWAVRNRRPVIYCSIDVPYFTSGPESVVVIHDHPRTYFHTRLYSSSVAYRALQMMRMHRFQAFTTIVADTNYVQNGLIESGVKGKVAVIYPPADPSFQPRVNKGDLRLRLHLPLDRKLILSVSSAEPRKNLPTVAKVGRELGSDYSIVRVGPALPGSVTFSNLPQTALAELYSACDVLLFPSLEEGFGYPVVEALAAGIPVVSSDIPVIREITGDAAVLVGALDLGALAAGVRRAVRDAEEYARRGLLRSRLYRFEAFAHAWRQLGSG